MKSKMDISTPALFIHRVTELDRHNWTVSCLSDIILWIGRDRVRGEDRRVSLSRAGLRFDQCRQVGFHDDFSRNGLGWHPTSEMNKRKMWTSAKKSPEKNEDHMVRKPRKLYQMRTRQGFGGRESVPTFPIDNFQKEDRGRGNDWLWQKLRSRI